ncbi:hypothetical protein B0H17DRAFT_412670 [Mycena rosella]|uniref:Uncharacterized protein n=1 Tax=Mycena rosella TaxID=1033263 RepID=A0AAD7DQI3_MYCRO|nr:hypothetical protein B0H17DRAFT_412670 [Mycena rosella]
MLSFRQWRRRRYQNLRRLMILRELAVSGGCRSRKRWTWNMGTRRPQLSERKSMRKWTKRAGSFRSTGHVRAALSLNFAFDGSQHWAGIYDPTMSNPGYANLLAHLHNPSTSLPLPTIQSALAHHLAKLAPLPTPLAAIAVSSPLFSVHPFAHPKIQALFTAFRHATHLKYRDSKDATNQSALGSVFSMSTSARVKHWAGAVLKGIKGGQPILRLACCGGLLAGLEDLRIAENLEIGRSQFEDEVVISVAESMDTYLRPSTSGGWEAEFQPVGDVHTMTLALILASQSLTLVAPGKLKALPLSMLMDLLTFTVTSAFASGTFLSAASSSTSREAASPSSTLRTINESPLMEFIAPISKLTALTATILCESRPAEGMVAAAATLEALRPISKTLESDWIRGASANAESLDAQGQAAPVWTTLKTLLFTNIMIADAALSAAVFVSPAAYSDVAPTPSELALTVLHTLSNLSFVISQFGGVTTTASPGFVELKKTFYLALDILAKSEEESNRFVRELCLSVQEYKKANNSDIQAKTAYALTCIEQLVPVLTGECIQSYALPLSLPYVVSGPLISTITFIHSHLSDPSHREVYESSHSVVLAIFASHADHHATGQDNVASSSNASTQGPRSTEKMVPFYARCLIENSVDGRLNTPQLRLAFASLVRSACASARGPNSAGDDTDTYALAWYCIDMLLGTIHELSLLRDGHGNGQDASSINDRLHSLQLTLVSVVPALPLKLLPRVLEEARAILTAHGAQSDSGETQTKELVDAMFVEISERVGDREKEYVMRWWYDNRTEFLGKADETRAAAVAGADGMADISKP